MKLYTEHFDITNSFGISGS